MFWGAHVMRRFSPLLWAIAAAAIGLTIRYLFGIEVLKQLLPYLIAAPCAYVLLNVFYIVRRSHRAARSSGERTNELYVGLLLAAWVVLIGLGSFQHWVRVSSWNVLLALAVGVLVLVPQLIRNRLTRGTRFVRPSPPEK
jgi:hypothetical protein